MKFNDKSELLTLLDIVKPAVSTKDFDPTLKCFNFQSNKIQGYNGEIFISLDKETDGDFLVQADTFYKLISAIPEKKEFEINVLENEIVVKVGKRIKATFPHIEGFVFPSIEVSTEGTISFPLSNEVLEGLKTCLKFIGKDETKPVYRGVFINQEGIFSTDGYRIAHYKCEFDGEIFLPESFCNLILKHQPKEFYQEPENSFLYFEIDGLLIISNKFEIGEKLPNYQGVIESAKESSLKRFIEIDKDLLDGCKRVSIFTEGLIDKYCTLNFSKELLTFLIKNSNIGEIEEQFPIEGIGYEDEKVIIDLILFQSILENSVAFEISPQTETRGFPVVRGVNDNLELVQITLNME